MVPCRPQHRDSDWSLLRTVLRALPILRTSSRLLRCASAGICRTKSGSTRSRLPWQQCRHHSPAPISAAPTPVASWSAATLQIQDILDALGASRSRQSSRDKPWPSHTAKLSDSSDQVRADAAVELGRQKAYQAIDALTGVLSGDRSPTWFEKVRPGHLASLLHPRSLQRRLQNSAQADTMIVTFAAAAQFAAEVIRGNFAPQLTTP